MARGSEQISSRWVKGAKRECARCGADITNLVRDVGETHTRYNPFRRWLVCMACHMGRK